MNNYLTETDNGLNGTFNNLSTNCLTSNDNKFNLDSNGNLTVNSITSALPITTSLDKASVIDLVYPVGSIYLSVNATSPATLFGGTWEQIKGRFLLGASANETNNTDYWGNANANETDFPLNEKGGEYRHVLTSGEMPSHNHNTANNTKGAILKWDDNISGSFWGYPYGENNFASSGVLNLASLYTSFTGNNFSHNNMPPYLAVSIWKRIS